MRRTFSIESGPRGIWTIVVAFVFCVWRLEAIERTSTVVKADGEPAGGVTVWFVEDDAHVRLNDRLELVPEKGAKIEKAITHSDGTLEFPTGRAVTLVVADPAGFVEKRVPISGDSRRIQLRRWGSLEGKLLIGTNSPPKERIRIFSALLPYRAYPRDFSAVWVVMETTTGPNGEFVFPKVPATSLELSHGARVLEGPEGFLQTQNTRVDVSDGMTERVVLGGKGRAVIGSCELSDYGGVYNWCSDYHLMNADVPRPAPLIEIDVLTRSLRRDLDIAKSAPEAGERASEERTAEVQDKVNRFYGSREGREYYPRKNYALNFTGDGRFRIEDVPQGKYRLESELHEWSTTPRMRGSSLARIVKNIEVPGGDAATPWDIGTIRITPSIPALAAGERAPDFTVNDLEGNSFKLSDSRGKFVLLEFWATWCRPCIGELPHLKETFEEFKDNDRFDMISLSLDDEAKIAKRFVTENAIRWKQGFLGESTQGAVAKSFRINGPPAIYLIGPDGKIVLSRLRGEKIPMIVEAALAAKEL